ncbi:hypothetical protein J2W49_002088 [Hydrogenophaga palleronii]|uniref:Uncharacterized protein n=1 Tax=Hydrogenophaga palleronii TaxID=65655 RepID=A0ABU1WLF8_9BURK|nr:hypothetical protein [Hydrogenophaga palleronii]
MTGRRPLRHAPPPDNRFFFVAIQGSRKNPGNTVSVIDLAGAGPNDISVTP